jgi:hypothetical protein
MTRRAKDLEDLTDQQIQRVLNMRGFQKMLAYGRLADGIGVLEDEGQLFDSMVSSITKQHGQIRSESSTREVLRLFRDEVETFTEPLVDEDGDDVEADDLEDLYVDDEEHPA